MLVEAMGRPGSPSGQALRKHPKRCSAMIAPSSGGASTFIGLGFFRWLFVTALSVVPRSSRRRGSAAVVMDH